MITLKSIPLKNNISLATLSTFKIGGKARQYAKVTSSKDLTEILPELAARRISYGIIGSASNIVFADTDWDELILQYIGEALQISANRILADGGVRLGEIINLSIAKGLQGLEFLAGIPGTIAGAAVGNAGAYGHSFSEVVEKVEIWDGKRTVWLRKSDCHFSYRESIFKSKPAVILRLVLNFRRASCARLEKVASAIIRSRLAKYKPGLNCPGSFFKNIPLENISEKTLKLIDKNKIIQGKIPAGYLLESVGAKNMKMGGIQIADFHGNLFLNTGQGKARDVKKLAEVLKKKVFDRFAVRLTEEIRYF